MYVCIYICIDISWSGILILNCWLISLEKYNSMYSEIYIIIQKHTYNYMDKRIYSRKKERNRGQKKIVVAKDDCSVWHFSIEKKSLKKFMQIL